MALVGWYVVVLDMCYVLTEGFDVLSLSKIATDIPFQSVFLENMFCDAGLVFTGHGLVFFVLIVVSYPKTKYTVIKLI